VAASQLHAMGMNELITNSSSEYHAMALDLACDSEKLKNIRSKLRENSKTSPLFDSKLYVKNLENTYRTIISKHAI
jgi:predicted O-linked N-acetylglucosamine transferase (SPINDLY family)